MDAVTGALVAGVVAWASILVVVGMPTPKWTVDAKAVRRAGAAAIATIAISVMGVGLPMWTSLAVFAVALGLQWLVAVPRAQRVT